jgi:hypothetical protein
MARGLEKHVLDGVNARPLAGSGCGSFCRGPLNWIRGWGLTMGSIPAAAECGDAAPDDIPVSCFRTNCRFSFSVPLRMSSQKLLFKRTTDDRRILSTTSLTLFDDLLSMFVLSAAQVLLQWSGGRFPRAAANPSVVSNAGCVVGA